MILTQILTSNALLKPKSPALIMKIGYRTITLTYQDVLRYAQGVAALLAHHDIQKGEAVLIYAPNSPFWTCVFWGTLLRGCRIVPVTTQSTPDIINRIIQHTNAKIIFSTLAHPIAQPGSKLVWFETASHPVRGEEPSGRLESMNRGDASSPRTDFFGQNPIINYTLEQLPDLIQKYSFSSSMEAAAQPDDIVEILYTSGTTGDPKGVMLSHKNLYSNVIATQQVIPLQCDRERVLSILPLSHIFEQTVGFLLPFSLRATIVYAHSPSAIRDLLCEYRITKLIAIPEFLKVLMSKIELSIEQQKKQRQFNWALSMAEKIKNRIIRRLLFKAVHASFGNHLTMIASGGAPLDPELEKKWSLLGMTILQGYGLSETSPIICVNSPTDARPGTVGKTIPGVDITIDPTDGEILVKGPSVFSDYFNDKEKTAQAFTPDGWFKTGDIGTIDADGFLSIKGRKKYMIKGAGAQNIYPEDIEEILNQQPGVKDSCVLGNELPNGHVELHAVLLLKLDAPLAQTIVDAANAKLASYQHITTVTVWPEFDFPRSATRKVKKEEVRAALTPQQKPHHKEVAHASRLVQLLAQLTGTPINNIHTNDRLIANLGLDSLLRIELIARIEELFGVVLEENSIRSTTTVHDLEHLLKHAPLLAKKEGLNRWPRFAIFCWLRTIIQLFISLVMRIFVRLEVKGTEHLKKLPLPVIFMPNHITYLDSIVVTMALPLHIRRKLAFAAARDVLYEELGHFALLGELFYNSFPFPRKEHENIKTGLTSMGTLLDQGFSVVVYPEGTMSKTGHLLPLKPGAGLIGVTMHATVIPMKIIGLQEVVPYGKFFPRRRGTVTVVFGAPIICKITDQHTAVTEKIAAALKSLN